MKVSEIILELMVKDVEETLSFYQDILGFELLANEVDADGRIYWAKLQFNNFLISFKDEKRLKEESEFMRGRQIGGGIAICIVVDDINTIHNDYSKKFRMLDHPHITPCGATQFSIQDNSGYVITFEKF